jgi:hypothetical protein
LIGNKKLAAKSNISETELSAQREKHDRVFVGDRGREDLQIWGYAEPPCHGVVVEDFRAKLVIDAK